MKTANPITKILLPPDLKTCDLHSRCAHIQDDSIVKRRRRKNQWLRRYSLAFEWFDDDRGISILGGSRKAMREGRRYSKPMKYIVAMMTIDGKNGTEFLGSLKSWKMKRMKGEWRKIRKMKRKIK